MEHTISRILIRVDYYWDRNRIQGILELREIVGGWRRKIGGCRGWRGEKGGVGDGWRKEVWWRTGGLDWWREGTWKKNQCGCSCSAADRRKPALPILTDHHSHTHRLISVASNPIPRPLSGEWWTNPSELLSGSRWTYCSEPVLIKVSFAVSPIHFIALIINWA